MTQLGKRRLTGRVPALRLRHQDDFPLSGRLESLLLIFLAWRISTDRWQGVCIAPRARLFRITRSHCVDKQPTQTHSERTEKARLTRARLSRGQVPQVSPIERPNHP